MIENITIYCASLSWSTRATKVYGVKIVRIGFLLGLATVASCGLEKAPQYSTETSTVSEVTVVSSTSVVVEETTTSTTTSSSTTTSTTTTTTVPVTTTTVMDTLCIRLTQCQYANLVGVDYSRLQLDFQNFSVASLTGASFAGTNLAQSLFIRANLAEVNFVGANLAGVDFTAANMAGANLAGANLTGTIFCDVDLETIVGLTDTQRGKIKKFKTKGKVYCP